MLTMGAAALGAFVSLPIAVGGGLGLGLVYQVVLAQTSNAGTAELAVFGVMLLAILVRGKAIARAFAAEGAAVPERPGLRVPEVLRGSPFLRNGMRWLIGLSLLVAVVFPLLPYFKANQFLLVLVLIYALVGVSLTMLVGWAGQVSLGQFALVGIGAYVTARWAGESGWSMVELLLVSGVVGAVVMVVIGLPALRVRGLTLAATTLGLAVIAPDWLYQQGWLGGSTPFNEPVQAMTVLPGLRFHRLSALPLLRRAGRARAGHRRRGDTASFGGGPDHHRGPRQRASRRVLRDQTGDGQAAQSLPCRGSSPPWPACSSRPTGRASRPPTSTADVSIAILAIPVIGGLGSLGGAVAAAVLLYMATFFVGPHVEGLLGSVGQNLGFLLFISGASVIGAMMQFPNGIAGKVQASWQAHLNKKAARLSAAGGAAPVPELVEPVGPEGDAGAASGTAIERAAAAVSFATVEGNEGGARRDRHKGARGRGRAASAGRRRGRPFRRHRCPERRGDHGRARGDRRPHRSERRGQDDVDERHQRVAAS